MATEDEWSRFFNRYPPLELADQENHRKKRDKDPFKGIYSNALIVFMSMPFCQKDTKKCCVIKKLEEPRNYQAIILEDSSNDRVFIMNTTLRSLSGDESTSLTYTAYSTKNINNAEDWKCNRRLTLRNGNAEEELDVQPNSPEHKFYKDVISATSTLLASYNKTKPPNLVCLACPLQENSLPGTVT